MSAQLSREEHAGAVSSPEYIELSTSSVCDPARSSPHRGGGVRRLPALRTINPRPTLLPRPGRRAGRGHLTEMLVPVDDASSTITRCGTRRREGRSLGQGAGGGLATTIMSAPPRDAETRTHDVGRVIEPGSDSCRRTWTRSLLARPAPVRTHRRLRHGLALRRAAPASLRPSGAPKITRHGDHRDLEKDVAALRAPRILRLSGTSTRDLHRPILRRTAWRRAVRAAIVYDPDPRVPSTPIGNKARA